MRKRLITFAVVGFVLYFMFTSPVEAATLVQDTVRTTGTLLQALADSLATFFRTLVRFTVANGQAVVPERGVFHPRGLSAGDLVAVEYDVTDSELVRVAGRSTVDGIGPMVLGVAGTWVVLGPLSVWLRRRRAAA